MVEVRDTFLHFLADNLPANSIHAVRRDPSDSQADLLQMDRVNVGFLDISLNTDVCVQKVSLDVVFDDELQGVAALKQLWDLLSAAFITPLLSYDNPSKPVPIGSNIVWDRRKVNFIKVNTPQYIHYSCVLPLQFHNPT